jgi:hypothetical protein
MIDDNTEQELSQIFGKASGWSLEELNRIKMCPGFEDIKALAMLLSKKPTEEQLQLFLEGRPQFLLGLHGHGDDSDLAFLTKPAIGSFYNADYAVLNVAQGGCSIHLIEIERADVALFTQKLSPGKALRSPMTQIRDWDQWISVNQQTFIRDILSIVTQLPLFPNRSCNNSFRLRSPESVESAWQHFGGYKHPHIKYTIIIGRWSRLSRQEQERLIFMNARDGSLHQIFTYDQLARRAYSRPTVLSYG